MHSKVRSRSALTVKHLKGCRRQHRPILDRDAGRIGRWPGVETYLRAGPAERMW